MLVLSKREFPRFRGPCLRVFCYLALVSLSPARVIAGEEVTPAVPTWATSTDLVSDDGHARLAWTQPDGQVADLWQLSESTPGEPDKSFYVDEPDINLFRITPGRYEFRVRACVRAPENAPSCGQQSSKLRLRVTEQAVPAPNKATPTLSRDTNVAVLGGPQQLRPGGWVNPEKDAQGWYFYWTNRLHHDDSDPLFGNAYDLVGVWYTFEAKSVYFDNEVCHCNLYDDYLPLTAQLRLVAVDADSYSGGIWVTRNGQDIQIGSAALFFGENNTNAVLNWSADFKFETIPATSETLVNLVSNDPSRSDTNAHLSGQWRQPGNNSQFVDELLTESLEVINISFQDDAGDPTWVQATSTSLQSGNVSFCAQYLNSGYRPDLVANNGFIYNYWYENACEAGAPANNENRNGRRYFPGFESGHFWAEFSLPGGAYNSGSLSLGSEALPQALQKSSNFHRISYDSSKGNSCDLQAAGSCLLSLTWFTDGDFPSASVWMHDLDSGSRTMYMSSPSPVVENQPLELTSEGSYIFELRMGDSLESTLIAQSDAFLVVDDSAGTPASTAALHGRWIDKPASVFELSWRHPEPGLVSHYQIEEKDPHNVLTSPPIHVSTGDQLSWSFDKAAKPQGRYQYRVRACNAQSCSQYSPVLNWYTQDPNGAVLLMNDDLESDQGWTRNRGGTDTATTGQWERANPSATSRNGVVYQLGTTVSGKYDLVTQAPSGSSWGSYDIDRGVTSMTSPSLSLPPGEDPTVLRFHYYFAHSSTANPGDFFRAFVEAGEQESVLLEELGEPETDGGAWQEVGIDLTPWAGQVIRIRFEAADGPDSGTIAEAGVDDIQVITFGAANEAPVIANPGDQVSTRGQIINVLDLAVSDADGDSLSCDDGSTLPSGLSVSIHDNAACRISGSVLAAAGTHQVTVSVSDNAGGTAATSFDWTVDAPGTTANPEVPPGPAAAPDMTPSISSSEVGATPGQFHVDKLGSATYSIPILTAPGSGGFTPRISLEYSSQSGNGPLGVGWSLAGLSAITRCAQTLEQDGVSGRIGLDSDDRYCLDGQRLLLVSGNNGEDGSEYRREVDDISRIRAFGNAGSGPSYFTVERKDGSVSQYGNSLDSKIKAGDEVLTWAQSRLEDRAGNYILFQYAVTTDPLEYEISQIEYTGNGAQAPFAKLEFSWANGRSDTTRVFVGGQELQQSKYLARIDSKAKKDAASPYASLRSYFLTYENDGLGRKSLRSVEECNNSSKQVCFDPTMFTWLKSLPEIGPSLSENNLFQSNQVLYGLQFADVSGDGRPDILYTRKSGPNYKIEIRSPNAAGNFTPWGGSYTLTKKEDGLPPRVFGIDLDADGYQDIIYRKHIENGHYQWAALRSTGSGLAPEFILSPTSFMVNEDQAGIEARVSVVDFNGDGLSDVMYNKTSALGDQHEIEVALNTWSPGTNLGLAAPVEISTGFGSLFPSPVGDGQGRLWETFDKPNFSDWNSTQLQGRNTPDARVFDFNGDGAVDVLIKVSREYRNCISGCPAPEAQPALGDTSLQAAPVYQHTEVAFWVLLTSAGNTSFSQQIIGLGGSCTLPDPCDQIQGLPATDHMWPVDINADGLADMAYSDNGNGWHFKLNTGAGFGNTLDMTSTPSPLPGGQQDLVRFEDFNGDGYTDLVYPSEQQNQSATWRVIYNRFGQFAGTPEITSIKAGNMDGTDNVENDASIFADFSGDGKTDHFYVNFSSQGKPVDSDLYLGRNKLDGSTGASPANVITRISNGLGAWTDIKYQPLTDPATYTRMNDSRNADWGTGSIVYDLVAPIYVVTQFRSNAPTFGSASASASAEYHYVGAKLQGGGRGFLGFGEVIFYDPQNGIRTNTRYRQDFPYIGLLADTTRSLVSSSQKFDRLSDTYAAAPFDWGSVTAAMPAARSSGTRLIHSINEWGVVTGSGGAVFPYIANSLERSYTMSGVFDRKILTNNIHDVNGNLISSDVKTFTTDGLAAFATRSTFNSYEDDTDSWRLGQMTGSEVISSRNGQPTITRQMGYAYDAATGMLNQEVVEPNQSSFRVTTDYTLDRFGNRTGTRVSGTGISARETRASYDLLGRFAVQTRNDYGQVTQKILEWDEYGNVLRSENIDGVLTVSAADYMGRPFANYVESGAHSRTTLGKLLASCPAGTAFKVTTAGGGVPGKFQCNDSLERTIRTATRGFDGSYIFVDQYFDTSGRAERVSEPYYEGSTRYWNQTTYDAIGRPETILSAAGDDQLFAYDADPVIACTNANVRVKQTTNGLGQMHIERQNALGETVEIFDDDCGRVSYSYDAVGNLIQVTGADGESVVMIYDLMGRKVSMDDPDKGRWQYAYNPLGEMTRQLDSRSQAIDFAYDALGRVTERWELSHVFSLTDSVVTIRNRETSTYQNSVSTSITGKGQPTRVVYRSGESGTVLHQLDFVYDTFGRSHSVITEVEGLIFHELTTYDQHSRVFQQFDASGDSRGIRSHYNVYGYLEKLQEAREGHNGLIYQGIAAMDVRGNATEIRLGNGVEVFANFDEKSGQLESLSAFNGTVELQNMNYLFDVLGNLKMRHDLSASGDLRETFNYDDLNRLQDVNLSVDGASASQTLEINYGAAGNITYKSDVGTYLYDSDHPHAVRNAGGVIYSYDFNGNQVAGGGRTISYTVFDKADRISKGNKETLFSYGIANGRYRREDVHGGVVQKATIYVGPVEQIEEGGNIHFKRYLGGVVVATLYPASGTQQVAYLLKDHLGSIQTVLNETGQITAKMHFDAFGQRQDIDWRTPLTSGLYTPLNDITTRGFTGHEQVDDLGIIHMNGRVYDARLGRFLQADPFVQVPKNSQNLNRYSYVLNNPLSYTDPSGFFLKRLIRKWGRVIVGAVAAYATFGATYSWAINSIASGAGSSISFAQFVRSVGARAFAGVIAGAASGFVGGALVSGSAKGAIAGAFSGALAGGVVGHFGDNYTLSRITSDAVAGGISAELNGERFREGLMFSALVSTATYLSVRAREYQVRQSRKVPNNIGSSDFEFRGVRGKIQGERINLNDWENSRAQELLDRGMSLEQVIRERYIPYIKSPSPLGCIQSGESCFFGRPITSDGFISYVQAGFGGIHDSLNQPFFYNADGTNRTLNRFWERVAGKVINPVNVIVAAPIAIPALIPDQLRHLYFQDIKR